MRIRRICRIDWRQGSLRWKPGDQILSPGNRHWNESDNAEGNNKPGIHPDTKTAIRWIMDSSMHFVECLHKQWILVSIALPWSQPELLCYMPSGPSPQLWSPVMTVSWLPERKLPSRIKLLTRSPALRTQEPSRGWRPVCD